MHTRACLRNMEEAANTDLAVGDGAGRRSQLIGVAPAVVAKAAIVNGEVRPRPVQQQNDITLSHNACGMWASKHHIKGDYNNVAPFLLLSQEKVPNSLTPLLPILSNLV